MLYVLCLILKYQLDVINNKITSGIIINYFICNEIIIFKIFNLIISLNLCVNLILIFNKYGDWGLGIGDWGLGIGDWAQSPIPNPQSPIPNPQSP